LSTTAAKKGTPHKKEEKREPGTSPIEWAVAGIGCLMLLAVIAYLVLDGISGGNGPARIVVEVVSVTGGEGGYVVEFSADNRAGKSVAGVEIKGELRTGEEVVEESSVTLDYIPQLSESSAALIFRNDPGAHELSLYATGYIEP
jgi:uncharacterized protein (TIGR02588 family)